VSASGFVPLALTAANAWTAVGHDIEETSASIRARIVRLREHPFYRTITAEAPGDPLVTGRVDGVDPELGGAARLVALLAPVLLTLFERAEISPMDAARAALLVALPAPDEVVDTWGLEEGFVGALERRLAIGFGRTMVCRSGHSGAIELCGEAAGMLASGAVEACIVAGVDSYLSPDRLAPLDEAYRLKSKRNVDGFVPGEGAAALLFESEARIADRGRRVLARVSGVGVGDEAETSGGERPSSGRGLCGALRAALGEEPVSYLLCDLNGESYRGFEWGIARARLADRLAPDVRMVFPAISTGDLGAAAGALLVGIAAEAFRRGYAPPGDVLVGASSEGPRRAAARLRRP